MCRGWTLSVWLYPPFSHSERAFFALLSEARQYVVVSVADSFVDRVNLPVVEPLTFWYRPGGFRYRTVRA